MEASLQGQLQSHPLDLVINMDSLWYAVLLSILDDLLVWVKKPKFPAPTIKVTFSLLKVEGDASMNPLLGTVTLSAPASGLNIIKRTVTVTVGTAAALTFDYLAGPVTFNCNSGDAVVVTAQDTTAGGLVSEIATLNIASAQDNTTKPASPTISVAFSPAPAPVVPAPTPSGS